MTRRPTLANVRRALERAGFQSGGGRDAGRMGRSLAHAYTSGFKCVALLDMATMRADPQLGAEVRSYGSRGPSLEAVAEALRTDFPDADVEVYPGGYVEVRAARRVVP